MPIDFVLPPRLQPGDKVAIVSPATSASLFFPWIHDLGIQRLREVFQLEPVEFPTARKSPDYLLAHPQARAEDINRAFADPEIKAVLSTLGGSDQVRILKYLDAGTIRANPKIYMGYSDNTNLHLYLWQQGIISYYGGALMIQFAMNGAMHDYTVEYFKRALFDPQIGPLRASDFFVDFEYDWADSSTLSLHRPQQPNSGWIWHNFEDKQVQGRLWGGCLEILDIHFGLRTYLPTAEEMTGSVLYIETSETLIPASVVECILMQMGEMGIFERISALLVGRPKAQVLGRPAFEGQAEYPTAQRETIISTVQLYAPDLPIVFNLDFGHTEPQFMIPNGDLIKIDGVRKTLTF